MLPTDATPHEKERVIRGKSRAPVRWLLGGDEKRLESKTHASLTQMHIPRLRKI